MLTTPFSRLNISCPCTECKTFLRPLPKDAPPLRFPPTLLPSSLGFSLLPTLATTPKPTPKPTPHTTPCLRPTAPTLAPSPAFLLTRSSPSKSKTKEKTGGPLALPSLSLEPWAKRVTFASRSLWANISSPINEGSTPISAKTPGLAVCAQGGCAGKMVPGFGRTVCRACEEALRGAVLGLVVAMEDEESEKRRTEGGLSRSDGRIVPSPEVADKQAAENEWKGVGEGETEPELFAIPSTPLSTKLLLTHSLHSTPRRCATIGVATREAVEQEAESALFALPNASLDRTYEDFTPTTKYAMDFPVLPASSKASKRSSREIVRTMGASKAGSKAGGKRISREILTATESTKFSLHASNSSMKWKLHER